jgi:hypothetical protein
MVHDLRAMLAPALCDVERGQRIQATIAKRVSASICRADFQPCFTITSSAE